jgi:thiamine-monophosphate kinase
VRSEFDIIRHFFQSQPVSRDDVIIGIGDDAAALRLPPDQILLSCTDTLVEGVHFPADLPAQDIGYRALAVNLSDMAAMGGEPAWALLALSIPRADEDWLQGFAAGLFELAVEHRVALVGGDTTRGPLTVTLHLHGFAPSNVVLRRSGARSDDLICVTGTLGDACGGLSERMTNNPDPAYQYCWQRFRRPQPRLPAGLALRNYASSCIDISDGLLADLSHILDASGCGATIEAEQLPMSSELRELLGTNAATEAALSGGDDYELCFTIPPARDKELTSSRLHCPVSVIGRIEAAKGLRIRRSDGKLEIAAPTGYQHF